MPTLTREDVLKIDKKKLLRAVSVELDVLGAFQPQDEPGSPDDQFAEFTCAGLSGVMPDGKLPALSPRGNTTIQKEWAKPTRAGRGADGRARASSPHSGARQPSPPDGEPPPWVRTASPRRTIRTDDPHANRKKLEACGGLDKFVEAANVLHLVLDGSVDPPTFAAVVAHQARHLTRTMPSLCRIAAWCVRRSGQGRALADGAERGAARAGRAHRGGRAIHSQGPKPRPGARRWARRDIRNHRAHCILDVTSAGGTGRGTAPCRRRRPTRRNRATPS